MSGRHKSNRLKAQREAEMRGMFWLPCPLCKEHFGGHE